MTRPLILHSGAWSDIPLEELAGLAAEWGYQGFELCSWGRHLDIWQAEADDSNLQDSLGLLSRFELTIPVVSMHRISQALCDPVDATLQRILPESIWADGDPNGISERVAEALSLASTVAQKMGVSIISGFSGSPIWNRITGYPQPNQNEIKEAFQLFAEKLHPVLDNFQSAGVKFAYEVHSGQMAFDIASAERALSSLDNREEFGFTFDASQLYWMGVDPCEFLLRFPDRIYNVHIKDIAIKLNGSNSLLNGCLPIGDPRRGWEFRSPGRGHIDWENIFRTLNTIQYDGPLSVEIADGGMDRLKAAEEAAGFLKRLNFEPPPENRTS